jgi:hypothetical protein
MLVDECMPVYDVSDAVATVVDADLATTWAALMDVDLIEVGRKRPLIAVLGALRSPPECLHDVPLPHLHGRVASHDEPSGGGWHPCDLALESLRIREEGGPCPDSSRRERSLRCLR